VGRLSGSTSTSISTSTSTSTSTRTSTVWTCVVCTLSSHGAACATVPTVQVTTCARCGQSRRWNIPPVVHADDSGYGYWREWQNLACARDQFVFTKYGPPG
jgi:transcription elongation factor Elf1